MQCRPALVVAAAIHLALITLVSCRDTFTVLIEGETLLPEQWSAWRTAESTLRRLLGESFPKTNPVRHLVGGYTNAAGIEAGYGFFAPNIPGTNKIIFELHHADGRVEQTLPTLRSTATAFRLASLLDLTARVKDDGVREGLVKYLVYAVWRDHSDVTSIRAILGTINFPAPQDFAHGERESYHASHVYDFAFETNPHN